MRRYRAVIFDMDGTLLDTLADLQASLNHALKACGYAERSRDEVQSFIGDGMMTLIARALPDELRTAAENDKEKETEFQAACTAVWESFRDYYIEHGEDYTRPYDGIVPLLKALRERGIKTAVVSNKMRVALDRLNDKLFHGLFDAAVGDGEGYELKPHPDMINAALSRLEVGRDDAVFVGDGDTDIAAAKNAGLSYISVCYGYRDEAFLRAHGGNIFAHDAHELAKLLGIDESLI